MNIGILLWNKCNASCAHCAPMSGPSEKPFLTNEQIFSIIDSSFHDCDKPKIGLSGGEAFLYYERLCEIVEYAIKKGASVSVNTNGSWAVTPDKAFNRLKRLKDIGLSKLVVSTDDYHEEFIKVGSVLNVVRACKKLHLEVELQFVASKKTSRLGDFLRRYGDVFINVRCREIPCHPVGRAADHVAEEDLFLQPGLPDGLCPSAIFSVSADGRYMPCCNTAGDLPALEIGTIAEPTVNACRRFKSSALLHVLTAEGPASLVPAAVEAGYEIKSGYVDQCHLCYDLFKSAQVAHQLKLKAIDIASEKLSKKISASVKSSLG